MIISTCSIDTVNVKCKATLLIGIGFLKKLFIKPKYEKREMNILAF